MLSRARYEGELVRHCCSGLVCVQNSAVSFELRFKSDLCGCAAVNCSAENNRCCRASAIEIAQSHMPRRQPLPDFTFMNPRLTQSYRVCRCQRCQCPMTQISLGVPNGTCWHMPDFHSASAIGAYAGFQRLIAHTSTTSPELGEIAP